MYPPLVISPFPQYKADADLPRLHYLMNVIGYDKTTAQQIIKEREARKIHRSPSRHAG
jgi:hypothetical protein